MDYEIRPLRGSLSGLSHSLSGKINLGVHERLSDLLTKEQRPFIVMCDVTFDGGKGGTGKVLFVNKRHMVWAEPEAVPR